ncbi:MAG: hypothetical protein ACLFRF_06170, partial [Desulfobacterales bacterium]
MSSILKALKKLEQDAGASADMPNLPGGGLPPVRQKFRLYALIGIGVLMAAGIFLFIRLAPAVLTTRTAENMDSRKTLHATGKKTENLGITGDLKTQRPAAGSERALSEAQLKEDEQKSVPEKSASGTDLQTNNDVAAQQLNDRMKDREPEAAAASTPPAQAAMAHPAADSSANTPQPPENRSEETPQPPAIPSESGDTPILEDIGLHIQAISWNETPSRRIAVINSRLCREGERCERTEFGRHDQ